MSGYNHDRDRDRSGGPPRRRYDDYRPGHNYPYRNYKRTNQHFNNSHNNRNDNYYRGGGGGGRPYDRNRNDRIQRPGYHGAGYNNNSTADSYDRNRVNTYKNTYDGSHRDRDRMFDQGPSRGGREMPRHMPPPPSPMPQISAHQNYPPNYNQHNNFHNQGSVVQPSSISMQQQQQIQPQPPVSASTHTRPTRFRLDRLPYYHQPPDYREQCEKAYKRTEKEAMDFVNHGIIPKRPTRPADEDDAACIANAVEEVKNYGLFDKFRRDLMELAVEVQPDFSSLTNLVLKTVREYLSTLGWRENFTRNVRETIRDKILCAAHFEDVVDRLVEKVLTPDTIKQLIPQIEETVYTYLDVPKPGSEEENKAKSEATDDDTKPGCEMNNAKVESDHEDEQIPSPPGESRYPLIDLKLNEVKIENPSIPSNECVNTPSPVKPSTSAEHSVQNYAETERADVLNYLQSQNEVSEEEDEEEEEESPAFEKFEETSPPRVDPEDFEKHFGFRNPY